MALHRLIRAIIPDLIRGGLHAGKEEHRQAESREECELNNRSGNGEENKRTLTINR